jgi:hypothetical protein
MRAVKVLDPGHRYELAIFDGDESFARVLQFVKREGEGYPGNVGHHEGTNIQEVLRALIDRLLYLDNQVPDHRNRDIVRRLRDSIWDLEKRAAERHGRDLQFRDIEHEPDIENEPVCRKCGHIGCKEAI